MHEVVLFALLGLGSGALTAALALALVVNYRGSGIVNLAIGAVAMVAGYAFWSLKTGLYGPHVGTVLSFVLALVVSLVFGVLMELLAFRPLRTASPLAKLVASLGILLVAQAAILLAFGPFPKTEPAILPNRQVTLFGYSTPLVNLILAGIVIAAAVVLTAVYRWSRFGLETKAAFENETSAMLVGLSVNRLSMTNTVLASGIAGAIGVLAAPVTQLDSQVFPLAIVPALAAAVFASFTSFGIACAAGLAIGAAQNILYYASTLSWFPTDHGVALPGVQQVLVLFLMVVALFWRGDTLPQRGELVEKRLPIAPRPERVARSAIIALVGGTLALIVLPFDFRQALVNTVIAVALTVSVIVITGYVGQVSVVQLALAGGAGFIVSHLATDAGIGFPAAPIIAAVGVTILGLLIAVSALRVRGVQLAVVTLAAAVAIQQFWYANITLGGGELGAPVPQPHLFGLDIGNDASFRGIDGKLPSPVLGFVILATTILLCVLVANLRRSTAGQRMLAVRSNERAAAAAGINVRNVKLTAFALSSFIAGIAGAMYAYNFGSVSETTFGALAALGVIAFAFVGGITFISGAVFAALISTEALFPHAFDKWFGLSGTWALLLGGIGVVFNLVLYPEGAAGAAFKKKMKRRRLEAAGEPARKSLAARALGAVGLERPVAAALGRNGPVPKPQAVDALAAHQEPGRVPPKSLEVHDLTVQFGGVTAVNRVSLTIAPGEIVGLIGPNGAGKSTLIDALSGFVRPSAGTIVLGGTDITSRPAHSRVQAGLVRSWQSVDLFDDISVRENMQIAAEHSHWRALAEVLRPRDRALSGAAEGAVRRFGLVDDLDRLPVELSFSQRRMVTTARSVALEPNVLLLDEPAGGFSDVRRAQLAEAIAPLARERGMGLLVVDHDMPFVMGLCDRIVVLNFGQKIADGTPEEVRADPAVVAAYLRGEAVEREDEEEEIAAAARSRAARRAEAGADEVLLAARELAVGYYEHPVVRGIDFEVRRGEVIALLGANRAGKTTTLLGLAGAIQPLEGHVEWLGEVVGKRVPLHKRATQGLGFLTDERSVFRQLTVSENLRVDTHCDPDHVLFLFPELEKLLDRRAGLLSGGEQQMLGLGRALARHPKVLLVDEMSLGLAPVIVSRLMEVLRRAADEQGVGVVLVEQHVQEALRISDRVCVVAGGRMTLTGPVDEVVHRVEDAFLADVLGVGV
jgi:branched-chain amino acid transport system permease protein